MTRTRDRITQAYTAALLEVLREHTGTSARARRKLEAAIGAKLRAYLKACNRRASDHPGARA